MKEFIEIYTQNPWLIAHHVLMLMVLVFACIRMGRHVGPSLCVVLSVLLGFTAFMGGILVTQILDIQYSSLSYKILDNVRAALWFVSTLLLFVAVFGWRGRNANARLASASLGTAEAAGNSLPAGFVPIRIPTAWVTTVTVLPVVAFVVGLALFPLLADSDGVTDSMFPVLVILAIGAVGVVITDIVLVLEILYRGWKAIQDEHVRTTPERAVGFLFIPFFSLYWIFVAWGGFARSFNAFVSRHQIPVRHLSEGLFVTYSMLMLVGLAITHIPIIGIVFDIGEVVVGLVVLWSITGGVNELHTWATRRRTEPPTLSLV